MTRENLISSEWHQKSPTYGHHVTKLFLESEFQHKGNKQMKKVNSKQNLVVFSAATDSEHKFSPNTTKKRTKQNLVHCQVRNLPLN